MSIETVGVIGCGVAGLQCIRSLRARGFQVTAFDKASRIGGVWRENYSNFGLQVPKQLFEFPDFPNQNARWGEFPSGEAIQQYIEEYAEAFQLLSCCRLNTLVRSIHQTDTGAWCFETDEGSFHFDFCIVATGMYSEPKNIPLFPGKEKFKGLTLHSSEFIENRMVEGQKVVVVGGGKSAIDCAVEAVKGKASSVTMLQRRPHWAGPRRIAGLVPFQNIFFSRFGVSIISAFTETYPGTQRPLGCFRPLSRVLVRVAESVVARQLGLTGELRPTNDLVRDFYGYAQVIDGQYKRLRERGELVVKQGSIDHYKTDSLALAKDVESGDVERDATSLLGEEELECDVVIFATGFCKDYTRLFSPQVVQALDVQQDGLYLHHHILPANVQNLAFIGSECASVSNPLTYGLQAEWIARKLFLGDLPTTEDREANIQELRTFASWMPKTSSRAALVLLHQQSYHDILLVDMGENCRRKSNCFAEAFDPYFACDYAGIVGAPLQVRPSAHQAPVATAPDQVQVELT